MSVYNFIPSGNPMLDDARKKRFDHNLAMQGGNPMLVNDVQEEMQPIDVQPIPEPVALSNSPMLSQPALPMAQAIPANPMFQEPQNIMEAIAAGIQAPQGQEPLGNYVKNNWMQLLQSGVQGLEDNAMRANLPADTYLKIKSAENEKEIAAQNNFLQNLKMQAEMDYQQQTIDLRKEELAQKRQEILMGGSGSSYMQDAMKLMKDDPSLSLSEAYAMARSGLPRGVVYDPSSGGVREVGGFADLMAMIAGKEAGSKAQATKDVELEMEPEIGKATKLAELEAETESELSKKERKSSDMIDIVNEAKSILPDASSGLAQAGMTAGSRMLGISTDASKVDKRLELMSGWLVSNVPRMEGPQSNFDVQNYQKMAADLGNPLLPYEDRLAAADELIKLQNKYKDLNGDAASPPPSTPESTGWGIRRLD